MAALENVVPPLPSDAAVALGAFLAHRHITTPLAVFLVVWITNFLGAAGVYFLARRYGRRLFATQFGRRLLAPEALAVVEREYLRFGVLGIVLGRFLPGIRAVVPPFAGLVNLSPIRTLVPLAVSSGIWYGGLTVLGTVIGAEWEAIRGILTSLNRTLAIVAAVAAVAGVIWWHTRRRRQRRERIWRALREAFGPARIDLEIEADHTSHRAAAMLLLELAYADDALRPSERARIEADLRERWGLPAAGDEPAERLHRAVRERTRFGHYTERIVSEFGRAQRIAVIERLWTVAVSDGLAEGRDSRLIHLSAELLGLQPGDLEEVRHRLGAAPDDMPPA